MEPYGVSVAIEEIHTSSMTYSIIELFIGRIYEAPNYSMTMYFTAPPAAQVHMCKTTGGLSMSMHKKPDLVSK